MVIPVGSGVQTMLRITKTSETEYKKEEFGEFVGDQGLLFGDDVDLILVGEFVEVCGEDVVDALLKRDFGGLLVRGFDDGA